MARLDLTHTALDRIAVFTTRTEAENTAVKSPFTTRQSVTPAFGQSGRVWVLSSPGVWERKPNTYRLLSASGAAWVDVPVNPISGDYQSPLPGKLSPWLERIEVDYPQPAPTRILADALTALLQAGVAARTAAPYAMRRNRLTAEEVHTALAPHVRKLEHMSDVPCPSLQAILADTAVVLSNGTDGSRIAVFLLVVLSRVMDVDGVYDIADTEANAARYLVPEPVEAI